MRHYTVRDHTPEVRRLIEAKLDRDRMLSEAKAPAFRSVETPYFGNDEPWKRCPSVAP